MIKLAINTSTLKPLKLDCAQQIKVSSKAGFEGIELWVSDILAYRENGGTPAELKSLLRNENIQFIDGISFIKWADTDAAVRAEALEGAKAELELLAELGCPHIAAPLCGSVAGLTLEDVAEQYRAIYELSASYGITSLLEIWGHSPVLNHISKAAYVLMESGVKKPLMLCDVYHAYRGGDCMGKLNHIGGSMLGLVHINDYPTSIPAPQIKDSDRVLPTEGDAPYGMIMDTLRRIGYEGYLSLETFPASYGAMTPDEAAAHAFARCKAIL
ncbi:MAG: sugar phosphate isomerase/epimerase [Eubacteriales bacterium]|nr:sugar phosphate isomerase/epimerase [Eubacteriales bacterium]